MALAPAVSPDESRLDRAERIRRMRELDAAGWSHSAIGRELGISRARVSQLLARAGTRHPLTDDPISAAEAALRDELGRLLLLVADAQRRVKVLERQLLRLEEEREAARIDRILGLA